MALITRILVATDFSETADAALKYGKELARALSAHLHVLHVVDDAGVHAPPTPASVPLDEIQAQFEHDARAELEARVTPGERAALRAELVVLTSATAAQAIASYARDEAIDLIVIGTHGRTGLPRFFLGSIAQQVTRSATCPVLMVRGSA